MSNFRISDVAKNGVRAPLIVSEAGFHRPVPRPRKPVAKDVCAVLGLDNVTNALRALDDDEKSNFTNCNVAKNGGRAHVDEDEKLTRGILGSGQTRNMTLINESGLYPLALSSKLPAAKEFQRLVTHEVLPQIRRTGGYIPVSDTDDEKLPSVRNSTTFCR